MSWTRAYPRFHMALWCAIALAWLILGANSANVPLGSTHAWVVANAVVAGTAFGVAYRRTTDSMFYYLIAALITGAVRSMAYLANGSPGPGLVWMIITLTNVILLGQWEVRDAER